jgi:putative spermidine/putrescine transport system substrate-binding protein
MNTADHLRDDTPVDLHRLTSDFRSGAIGRRDFLAALGAAGLTVLGPRSGSAAPGQEIVVANWGGPAATAFSTVWGPPVQSKLDAKLVIDGSGPSAGKVRAMVDAGNVIWDVCDASVGAALLLGEESRLEAIDYSIVGDKVRPEYRYKYAVCNYIFSYVLAFNRSALGSRSPTSWKDFWNVKDFPGKRMLRGSCIGQLECALLADSVPADKIYPIDLPRALKKIAEIKEHTVFWKTGSQSEDLFRQNEVVMGNMWHNRTNLLRVETKGNIDWTWAGGVIAPAVWLVPKHNPAGKQKAMEFIALSLEPAGQVELFKIIGMGPSNPAASALIPQDLRRYDPAQPENLSQQILINDEWYGQNLIEAEAKYLDVISS